MIARPALEAISSQSPWRETPGCARNALSYSAPAVLVAPEARRHRRHRLREDEFADLADHRTPRPRPYACAAHAPARGAWSSPVDRQVGTPPTKALATSVAAGSREQPARPPRAARRSSANPSGASGASRWSRPRRRREPAPGRRRGSMPSFIAGRQVGPAAAPNVVISGVRGEVPERVGTCVCRGCRRRERSRPPAATRTPTKMFHIAPPRRRDTNRGDRLRVARRRASSGVLELLEEDPPAAPDDPLGPVVPELIKHSQWLLERAPR